MKVVCISHAEDADGLICAAYLRRLRDASIILVTYDDFKDALDRVQPPTDEVYICDLNIREDLSDGIIRISGFADVTIVDHHPTSEEALKRLEGSGIVVVYSPLDCAAMLLYHRFREELGREEARLAAYAAVSDQFEEGPLASKLLGSLDRQFIQHEALILTHSLHRKAEIEFRSSVVEELSKLTPPHRIEGAPEEALAYLEEVARLLEHLPKKASRMGRLAYIEAFEDTPIGAVAGLLIDAMDVDVGVCYKPGESGSMNLSIRGRRGLDVHLGEISKRLAENYNGFGGGHRRASGASIPKDSYMEFIKDIENALESNWSSHHLSV